MDIVKHIENKYPRAIMKVVQSKSIGKPVREMESNGSSKPFGVMIYGICASIGMSNAPEPILVQKIEQTTLDYYADFTDKEVILAYDLGAAGLLDLGKKGFNIYELNLESHCRILKGYREYRAKHTPFENENEVEAKISDGEKFLLIANGIMDDCDALYEGIAPVDLASVKAKFLELHTTFKLDYDLDLQKAVEGFEEEKIIESSGLANIGEMLAYKAKSEGESYKDYRVKKLQSLWQYTNYLTSAGKESVRSQLQAKLDTIEKQNKNE